MSVEFNSDVPSITIGDIAYDRCKIQFVDIPSITFFLNVDRKIECFRPSIVLYSGDNYTEEFTCEGGQYFMLADIIRNATVSFTLRELLDIFLVDVDQWDHSFINTKMEEWFLEYLHKNYDIHARIEDLCSDDIAVTVDFTRYEVQRSEFSIKLPMGKIKNLLKSIA